MVELKPSIYKFGEFRLDTANREFLRGGEKIQLSAKAFDLLQILVENNGKLVSKDEIFSRVWKDQIVEESNLTVHISQIRKALGETKNNPRFITTVPGYGYRFSGDVDLSQNELIIETRTLSRITIEEEKENEDDLSAEQASLLPENETVVDSANLTALKTNGVRSRNRKTLLAIAIGLLFCAILAFGAYRYSSGKNRPVVFEKIKVVRATNSGNITGAAISPDGKYIAYAVGEEEGKSLWLQQIGTASHIRILPPVKGEIYGLTYSPDGAFIYYNLYTGEKTDIELFRIPSLGGVVEKIPNVVSGDVRFSPDGKRIAFIVSDSAANSNYLVTADTNGKNQQIIAKKEQPYTFEIFGQTAWSPDGETIACLVYQMKGNNAVTSLVGFNVKNGSEKIIGERSWYDLLSIEWLKDGSGLLVSAAEKIGKNNQVWFVSYPDGSVRQITNDLSSYTWLSSTADAKTFVALQNNRTSTISIGEIGGEGRGFKEIAAEVGTLNPVFWTSEGKIAFRSDKDGTANVWTTDAEGNNRRQITTNAEVDSRAMCVSSDGKYAVFGSWRNGRSNLWRADWDGGNLKQLTDGEADVYPTCSPDGKWIVYQQGLLNPKLFKVSIEGGEPVQLTDFRAKWAAVSRDGSRIAFLFMADGIWQIGVISMEGGALLHKFTAPANLTENTLYWSPDNQSLYYIGVEGSVGNIWRAPLDGTPAKRVTNFNSHLIADFSLSPDGKQFVVTRTASTSDVVLIENAPEN